MPSSNSIPLPSTSSLSIPITILCGFLGSGKTTLLNQLLTQFEGQNIGRNTGQNMGLKKVVVIVNEFGAVNIDAGLVVKTDEKTIELSNGCICCTLRGDLLEAVDELIRTRDLDAIFIESTGIGEPLPIAQAFCLSPEDLELEAHIPNLVGKVHVDALITVVDSAQFFELWNRRETLEGDEQARGYGELLAEQLEFANIIVLNKTDLADSAELNKLRAFVSKLNPGARILQTVRGNAPLEQLIHTDLFDMEELQNQQAWHDELEKEHTPESESYGLNTYIYRSSLPFDEAALWEILERGLMPNILRSKGWIAYHGNPLAHVWNHSGRLMVLEPAGEWNPDQEPFSEIVFIGEALEGEAIEGLLEAALVSVASQTVLQKVTS